MLGKQPWTLQPKGNPVRLEWAGIVLFLQCPPVWPQALLASLWGHSGPLQEPWCCYSQRVQRAEALEGIRRNLRDLVVAQVSAQGAGEREAEWLNPSVATKPCLVPSTSQMP